VDLHLHRVHILVVSVNRLLRVNCQPRATSSCLRRPVGVYDTLTGALLTDADVTGTSCQSPFNSLSAALCIEPLVRRAVRRAWPWNGTVWYWQISLGITYSATAFGVSRACGFPFLTFLFGFVR